MSGEQHYSFAPSMYSAVDKDPYSAMVVKPFDFSGLRTTPISGLFGFGQTQQADVTQGLNLLRQSDPYFADRLAGLSPEMQQSFFNDLSAGKLQLGNNVGSNLDKLEAWKQQQVANSQSGFNGINGLQWGQFALNLGMSAYDIYNKHQNLKLARQNYALNKEVLSNNYRNQALTIRQEGRDRLSGRGYVGMSNGAKTALGKQFNNSYGRIRTDLNV